MPVTKEGSEKSNLSKLSLVLIKKPSFCFAYSVTSEWSSTAWFTPKRPTMSPTMELRYPVPLPRFKKERPGCRSRDYIRQNTGCHFLAQCFNSRHIVT